MIKLNPIKTSVERMASVLAAQKRVGTALLARAQAFAEVGFARAILQPVHLRGTKQPDPVYARAGVKAVDINRDQYERFESHCEPFELYLPIMIILANDSQIATIDGLERQFYWSVPAAEERLLRGALIETAYCLSDAFAVSAEEAVEVGIERYAQRRGGTLPKDTKLFVSKDLYDKLRSSSPMFQPLVQKHPRYDGMVGYWGKSAYPIHTDAARPEAYRVLEDGELIIAAANSGGQLTTRGLTANAYNGFAGAGKESAGWNLSEFLTVTVNTDNVLLVKVY